MDYLALRALVEKRGLLAKAPWYYARLVSILVGLFATLLILYYVIDNTAVRILVLLGLAILAVQFGFLGHDAHHRAVSAKEGINKFVGRLSMTLVNGVGSYYWNAIHNAHHKDPNTDPGDPDIDYVIALDEQQARRRTGVMKKLTKYQAFLFVPVHSLVGFSMTYRSCRHFLSQCNGHQRATEIAFLLLHVLIWIALPAYFFGVWKALLFYVLATLVRGLYFSMSQVPNHVGMPLLPPGTELPFVQKQVVTARNITPSWFKDFLLGGLNYQIEHHLFPATPRRHLRSCRKIVKEFCAAHGISYKEDGFFKSYKDIFVHVHNVGKAA